jgi:hypothetical protein
MRLGTPIDYLSSRGEDTPLFRWHRAKEPVVGHRRAACLLIILAACLTFFMPLITVDPPVHGTARWSPFAVVLQVYKGNLNAPVCERCGEPWVRAVIALPVTLSGIYALLLLTLVPLSVPYAWNTVAGMAFVAGLGALYMGRYGTRVAMDRIFYGSFLHSYRLFSYRPQAHYFALQICLIAACAALFVISASSNAD